MPALENTENPEELGRHVPVPHGSPGAAPDARPVLQFDSICQGQSEVLIEFRGQQYRLRVTQNGKLILNK